MKSDDPIFQRLLGLETEYAIRFRPHSGFVAPTQIQLYRSLLEEFRKRLPIASGSVLEEKHFTANGGTIGFERVLHAGGFGLIEAATPECCTPRELLTWQRAQDRLLSQCAAACRKDGEFVLIKNSRDSEGHAYGTHENYQIHATSRIGLFCWRIALLLASVVCLLFWLIVIPLIVLVIPSYLLIAGIVYFIAAAGAGDAQRKALFRKFFGDGFDAAEDATPIPRAVEKTLNLFVMSALSPMMLLIILTARLCLFRKHTRLLTPFLVSRSILSGSGWVSGEGEFFLAQKSPVISILFGPVGHRSYPLFSVAHLMDACLIGWFNPTDFLSNFGPSQRLQVCLGDCNMAQEAEYLRVATTALLIDAIEAGAIKSPPRVKRPLQAMHTVARDASLSKSVAMLAGRPLTALEVQRWYLNACRRFLENHRNPPDEAYEVLQRWSDSLDALIDDPDALIGRIDWVTKRMLLQQSAHDLTLEAKRKIDMKYHELSESGYFAMVESTGTGEQIVGDQQIEHAMRQPPSTRRAIRRAGYIREFSSTETPIHASWNSIRLGKRFGNKRIRL